MLNGPLGVTVSEADRPLVQLATKAGSFISAMELADGKR